jgi:hydroxyethylthiazole kinase-like uncharacterized protein yjeF
VELAWGSDDVRAAEEPLLAAGVPLMDRAAFALSVVVARELRVRRGRVAGARVVLLVGPGNNGGDALFAGADLARRGVAVTALLTGGERVHAAGQAALLAAGGRAVPVDDDAAVAEGARRADAADVVLDGLLGIGARGALRGVARRLVEAISADPDGTGRRPLVVAVDVPSGIGVDDGTLPGPVLPADLTVTFGGVKPGLLLPPAALLAGSVRVVDVGLGLGEGAAGPGVARRGGGDHARGASPVAARLGTADLAARWSVPGRDAQKYSRGVLGVVAGTRAYPGAAVLVTGAAVGAGVGMVRYLGDVGDGVLAAHPEVVVGPGRVQAWAVGSGVDPADAAQARRVRDALDEVVRAGLPAVVDAGALALLPDRVPAHVVLTPHAGELATLLSAREEPVDRAAVEAAPLAHARRAHELTGATVLLKGAVTVVVGADGAVLAQDDGPAWLATAGSGDVLAGVLGALLAGHGGAVAERPALAAELAAVAAAAHGRAAWVANPSGPVSASALVTALPATVAGVLAGSDVRECALQEPSAPGTSGALAHCPQHSRGGGRTRGCGGCR